MCWNCRCGLPESDMGCPEGITTNKILKAARAGGNRNIRQAMLIMIKTYEEKIRGTPADTRPIENDFNRRLK